VAELVAIVQIWPSSLAGLVDVAVELVDQVLIELVGVLHGGPVTLLRGA
jgi:hypothetical protein